MPGRPTDTTQINTTHIDTVPPVFDAAFQHQLTQLFAWRRDVRRFRRDPVPAHLITDLLDLASLSPSVGNSQPWRFVLVESPHLRAAVIDNFRAANRAALDTYEGEQARLYASLKLQGLENAPVQVAVFSDNETHQGHFLGRMTMPEALAYSAVGAIHTLWLAARARGIGMGWLSILQPRELTRLLDVPSTWQLIGYLCIGWPQEEHLDPELERHGWQTREPVQVLRR